MRKIPYLITAIAVSGLAVSAGPVSANPLASGLANGIGTVASLDDGLVQKVHGWHCRKRKGWYRGHKRWHRHRRACEDYDYSYHQPYYYGGYPYAYGGPVISFEFGNRRHHRRHHWDYWD